jgi:hypothetical protein
MFISFRVLECPVVCCHSWSPSRVEILCSRLPPPSCRPSPPPLCGPARSNDDRGQSELIPCSDGMEDERLGGERIAANHLSLKISRFLRKSINRSV